MAKNDDRLLLAPRDLSAFRTDRVGLAVMDNAFHHGHIALLTRMLCACDRAIIGFGSSQAGGTVGHPFTFSQKKEMVEGVFGRDVFTFVSLNDIRATRTEDWVNYVLKRIDQMGLPRPTDYFGGSPHDVHWYESAFARTDGPHERAGPETVYRDPASGRALHLLDRDATGMPSGRQVRELIELRNPEWRHYVPQRLWKYIEMGYPPKLRVALQGDEFPDPGKHPVGTLFQLGEDADAPLYELMDDEQWRQPPDGPDEKAEHARRGFERRHPRG